jgi:hypothetical protein
MTKYQEIQATTGKFAAGNSELFINKIRGGRLHFADSWTSE